MIQSIHRGNVQPCSFYNARWPRRSDILGRRSQFLGLTFALINLGAGLGACVVAGESSVSTARQEQLSCNQLLIEDVLDSQAALLQAGNQSLDASIQSMVATQSGRNLAQYLAICALEPTDSVSVDHEGETYHFDGRLALAPEWRQGALSSDAGLRLSGCILAHVNAFGEEVPISVRVQEDNGDTDLDETTRYNRHEAAFYGDLFAATPTMYACIGTPVSDLNVPFGAHDMTLGDRLLRRCADEDVAGSGQTLCGFTFVGTCADVCDQAVAGNYSNCWSSPARTGAAFVQPTNVWTLDHHDPEAVWPTLYPQVYGD